MRNRHVPMHFVRHRIHFRHCTPGPRQAARSVPSVYGLVFGRVLHHHDGIEKGPRPVRDSRHTWTESSHGTSAPKSARRALHFLTAVYCVDTAAGASDVSGEQQMTVNGFVVRKEIGS